jgi:formylglycine-generating enzyme required for sulfatase activity
VNTEFEDEIKAVQVALESGRVDEASEHLANAQKLKPSDPELVEITALVTQRRQFIKMDEDYKSATIAAQLALDSGNYDVAMSQAQTALNIKPGDEMAGELKRQAQQQQAKVESTRRDAEFNAMMRAAQSSLDKTNYEAAITQAQAALNAKPGDSEARKVIQIALQKKEESLSKPIPVVTGEGKSSTNSYGMEFVWVSMPSGGGVFMGKYEVTQKQFSDVMGKVPDGQVAIGANLPVANVSFSDAKLFCERLTTSDNKKYFLPTKQEWLAAAGLSDAQVQNAWDIIKNKGLLDKEVTSWNVHPALTQPAPVGSRGTQPNGLCDLFGNVREWIATGESAGFSYDAEGFGSRDKLFYTHSDLQYITGFRCAYGMAQ